jgi:nucleoporin SEH1
MSPGYTLYSSKFPIKPHTSTINDVAWAPLVGRSYHMIASCSRERVVVWKVIVRDIFQGDSGLYKDPIIEALHNVETHIGGEVWRLSWNLLGTCVASSGDDGTVRLWRKNVRGGSAAGFSQIACL